MKTIKITETAYENLSKEVFGQLKDLEPIIGEPFYVQLTATYDTANVSTTLFLSGYVRWDVEGRLDTFTATWYEARTEYLGEELINDFNYDTFKEWLPVDAF